VEQAIAACGHAGPCDGGGDFTPPEQNCRFTEREAAVLQRLRQGQPNKIIAHGLGISESTVKAHLRSIMAKLKVTDRTQIVCLLASHGEPEHAEL
ncbi:MAG: response regulator transcription factor, partial [Rhizobiales bacterium]|nr:response regulator transcription factor [Hyphomicrobiales bacterium]